MHQRSLKFKIMATHCIMGEDRKVFRVLGHTDTDGMNAGERTMHHAYEGYERHSRIAKTLGEGMCVDAFVVDKGHPNGNEVHYLCDNGVIVVTNQRTGKVVTELIARPAQIRRYYEGLNEPFPSDLEYLLDLAMEHTRGGYNVW